MADIYEINLKTGISIKKLKSMDRQGYLNNTKPDNPEITKMQFTLRKGNRLSALDLVRLIESPDLIFDLGDYAYIAEEQVESLGDAKSEAAEPAIATIIYSASTGHPEQVEALEQWMKQEIPTDREVPHHYLATRALLGVPVHSRRYIAGRIPRAFLNVRGRPSFSSWFTLRPTCYARNATFYHHPKLEFDRLCCITR